MNHDAHATWPHATDKLLVLHAMISNMKKDMFRGLDTSEERTTLTTAELKQLVADCDLEGKVDLGQYLQRVKAKHERNQFILSNGKELSFDRFTEELKKLLLQTYSSSAQQTSQVASDALPRPCSIRSQAAQVFKGDPAARLVQLLTQLQSLLQSQTDAHIKILLKPLLERMQHTVQLLDLHGSHVVPALVAPSESGKSFALCPILILLSLWPRIYEIQPYPGTRSAAAPQALDFVRLHQGAADDFPDDLVLKLDKLVFISMPSDFGLNNPAFLALIPEGLKNYYENNNIDCFRPFFPSTTRGEPTTQLNFKFVWGDRFQFTAKVRSYESIVSGCQHMLVMASKMFEAEVAKAVEKWEREQQEGSSALDVRTRIQRRWDEEKLEKLGISNVADNIEAAEVRLYRTTFGDGWHWVDQGQGPTIDCSPPKGQLSEDVAVITEHLRYLVAAGPLEPPSGAAPSTETLVHQILAFMADIIALVNGFGDDEDQVGKPLDRIRHLLPSELQRVKDWSVLPELLDSTECMMPSGVLAATLALIETVGAKVHNAAHLHQLGQALKEDITTLVFMFNSTFDVDVLERVAKYFMPKLLDERLQQQQQQQQQQELALPLQTYKLVAFNYQELPKAHCKIPGAPVKVKPTLPGITKYLEGFIKHDKKKEADFRRDYSNQHSTLLKGMWMQPKLQEWQKVQQQAQEPGLGQQEQYEQYEALLEKVLHQTKRPPYFAAMPVLKASLDLNPAALKPVEGSSGVTAAKVYEEYVVPPVEQLVGSMTAIDKAYLRDLTGALIKLDKGILEQQEEADRDLQSSKDKVGKLLKERNSMKRQTRRSSLMPKLDALGQAYDIADTFCAVATMDGPAPDDSLVAQLQQYLDQHTGKWHRVTPLAAVSGCFQAFRASRQTKGEDLVLRELLASLEPEYQGSTPELDVCAALSHSLGVDGLLRGLVAHVSSVCLPQFAQKLADAVAGLVVEQLGQPHGGSVHTMLRSYIQVSLGPDVAMRFGHSFKASDHWTLDNVRRSTSEVLRKKLGEGLKKRLQPLVGPSTRSQPQTRAGTKRQRDGALSHPASTCSFQDVENAVLEVCGDAVDYLKAKFLSEVLEKKSKVQKNVKHLLDLLGTGAREGSSKLQRMGKITEQYWACVEYVRVRARGTDQDRLVQLRCIVLEVQRRLQTYIDSIQGDDQVPVPLMPYSRRNHLPITQPGLVSLPIQQVELPNPVEGEGVGEQEEDVQEEGLPRWMRLVSAEQAPVPAQRVEPDAQHPVAVSTDSDLAHQALELFITDTLRCRRLYNPGGGNCGLWAYLQASTDQMPSDKEWDFSSVRFIQAKQQLDAFRNNVVDQAIKLWHEGGQPHARMQLVLAAGLAQGEELAPEQALNQLHDWGMNMRRDGVWVDSLFWTAVVEMQPPVIIEVYPVGSDDLTKPRQDNENFWPSKYKSYAAAVSDNVPRFPLAFLNIAGEGEPNHYEAMVPIEPADCILISDDEEEGDEGEASVGFVRTAAPAGHQQEGRASGSEAGDEGSTASGPAIEPLLKPAVTLPAFSSFPGFNMPPSPSGAGISLLVVLDNSLLKDKDLREALELLIADASIRLIIPHKTAEAVSAKASNGQPQPEYEQSSAALDDVWRLCMRPCPGAQAQVRFQSTRSHNDFQMYPGPGAADTFNYSGIFVAVQAQRCIESDGQQVLLLVGSDAAIIIDASDRVQQTPKHSVLTMTVADLLHVARRDGGLCCQLQLCCKDWSERRVQRQRPNGGLSVVLRCRVRPSM